MRKAILIEKKIYKRRNRWKKWKAYTNYYKNLQKKSQYKKDRRIAEKPKIIQLPNIFSITNNRSEVLDFFSSLNKLNVSQTRYIFFDSSKMTDISHGAITVLLSMIGWLNDRGISVSGNLPNDGKIKEKFERSGFLSFFRTIGTRNYERSENVIVARGEKKTNSELTARLIRKSSKTVWGQEDKNPNIQGMVIELMANAINHAYLGKVNQKGWYLAIEHLQEENKVKFCFVDNGLGILKTLQKRFPDKIATLIGGKRANNIIRRAFEGEFGSRTKLSNRGRGLKAIKKVFEKEHISSLKIITNNIFYDFDLGVAEELKEYFEGTVYFWEVDKSCKR